MMGSAGICVLIKEPRCAGPDVEGAVPNEILPSNDAGYDERYLFGFFDAKCFKDAVMPDIWLRSAIGAVILPSLKLKRLSYFWVSVSTLAIRASAVWRNTGLFCDQRL
jgi:hypothetical protein